MRFLCSIFVGLACTSAAATGVDKSFVLQCTTSVAELTLSVSDGRLHMHLDDANGFMDFPIYSGTVTESMMPIIARGEKDLAVFDGDVDISWDLAKCTSDSARPLLVSCSGIGQISSPENAPLVATSMSTSTDHIDSMEVQADVVNVNFGLSTTGTDFMHYYISLPFDSFHCAAGSGTPVTH